ncbi:MAG: lipid-A-disaccharide synthase [Thermoguttaceae bacterium]
MSSPALRLFFCAGEPSGDLHAANLIRQLQQRCRPLEAVGYGGPRMAAVGCRLHADLTELAVMWFGRALANLHKFWDLAGRADRYFRHHRPDAVVLIDYPGFNWWVAWRAKIHGIPVFYYTPPQIWAWATWRAKKMRRLSDHVLCSLPFEEEWFRQRGCNATFVGHPFFDEVRQHKLDDLFLESQRRRSGPLVTILPGSRTQEVLHNFPWFLKAAACVRQAVPEARFAVAAFKPKHAQMAEEMAVGSGQWAVGGQQGARSKEQGAGSGEQEKGKAGWHTFPPPTEEKPVGSGEQSGENAKPAIDIYSGRTPELMQLATCCMACSGSVSMELLYYTKPTVIHYWISPLAYAVQRRFRKVKYITLVNLLSTGELYPADLSPYDPSQPGAEKVLFPEYLTCEDKSAAVAGHVIEWLRDPAALARQISALEQLKAEVAHGGASARAAKYILRELTESS